MRINYLKLLRKRYWRRKVIWRFKQTHVGRNIITDLKGYSKRINVLKLEVLQKLNLYTDLTHTICLLQAKSCWNHAHQTVRKLLTPQLMLFSGIQEFLGKTVMPTSSWIPLNSIINSSEYLNNVRTTWCICKLLTKTGSFNSLFEELKA